MLTRAALCTVLIALLALGAAPLAQAQTPATLSFELGTTALQTAQTYDVGIRLDGAADTWVVNVEVGYDPQRVYVLGTQSGSPVGQGTLFAPMESSIVVRNAVQRPGLVIYTISMLAPADPINADGVIGVFRIYPLSAGETSLTFRAAEATSVTFTGTGANRTPSDPQSVPVTAVLTTLSITGDTVEPPSEATATPAPTETPGQGQPFRSENPGVLPNVTAAPGSGETPAAGETAAPVGMVSLSTPLIIMLGVAGVAGIGAVVLFVLYRRRR